MTDPFHFYDTQAPNFPSRQSDFSPQALAMTMQMANVLLLLGAIAIICCWTTYTSIARWYLIAVALADFGHIYGTYKGVGPEYFWNIGGWNDMVWGNVGVSAFLNVNRWLTVLGLFGRLRAINTGKKRV